MNTIFVLLMFIPYGNGSAPVAVEFNDEMACYEGANKFRTKLHESLQQRFSFVCVPKGSKK